MLTQATGPSAGHIGYDLAGQDPGALAEQIQALTRSGQSQTITLGGGGGGGGGGTLALNGATLTFAVLSPISAGGSTPHG